MYGVGDFERRRVLVFELEVGFRANYMHACTCIRHPLSLVITMQCFFCYDNNSTRVI